jgi:hypothetical protein
MTDKERAIEIALKHGKMKDFSKLAEELRREMHKTPREVDDLLNDLVRRGKLYTRGEGSRDTAEDPTGKSDPKAWFEKW